jgi:hypothetical protein
MRLRCARASLRSSEEDSVRARLREGPGSGCDSGAGVEEEGEGEGREREEGSTNDVAEGDIVWTRRRSISDASKRR